MPNPTLHADGTPCPEGTGKLPRAFAACCDAFAQHTRSCYVDLRYEWWTRSRAWFIVLAPEAGGGGIRISFCPHCGSDLRAGAGKSKVN
jgi:hypothetical protein